MIPIFKKSLIIPFQGSGKDTSTSHNKDKTIYQKQQAKNNIWR